METGSIAAALIKEHDEIDAGIADFIARAGKSGAKTDPAAAREIAGGLHGAFAALRRHIYLEEEFVFPALTDPSLVMAMMVMYREHGVIWRLMDQAERQITDDAADPSAVIATCQEMLGELEKHNAKEEPIIYPRNDADLSREQQAKLSEFLAFGQMPDGWTCREAASGRERKLPF